MFKKGQLAKVKGTRDFYFVEWYSEMYDVVKVRSGIHCGFLRAEDIELIGNNFKFKGAK